MTEEERQARNAYAREWYAKNKDRRREYRRQNKDQINAYHREWCAKNKEQIKAREEQRLAKMSDEEREALRLHKIEYIRNWQRNNPEKLAEYQRRYRKRKAGENG